MFIENKYTKCYLKIVDNARLQNRVKSKESYYESHHIFPTSIGGSNIKSNKVLLTAKEHFICHLLLTKMVEGEHKKKMCYAIQRLYYSRNKKHGCRTYSLVKAIHSRNVSESLKGKKKSLDHVSKISLAKRGKKLSESHIKSIAEARTGWLLSDETKNKIALSNTGKRRFNDGSRNVWLNPNSVPIGYVSGWL